MPPSLALVNPAARNGKAASLWRAQLPQSCEAVLCTSPEDIEAQAYNAAQQNVETIIAIGGDGTVHYAANGILRAGDTTSALAVIPAGTANDYWATLSLYAEQAKHRELRVDVGSVRQGAFERCFVNACGIGFSAETAAAAHRFKKWPPRMRYVLGVIDATRKNWAITEVALKFDHQAPNAENLFLLSVAKGRREGSFTLAPQARLDDGQLHILTATDLLRRDVFRYLPGICLGRLPKSDPRIRSTTAMRVTLKSDLPLRFHLDGELFDLTHFTADQEVEVRVLPKRLRIHFPQAQL